MANSGNPEVNRKIARSALATLVISAGGFYLGNRYGEALTSYPGQFFEHWGEAFTSMWPLIRENPIQPAQSQNMYDHQEDIVKYVTLDSLKDAGIYAVSQELADALDTDVDYEGADSFDAALDEAKEQVQNVMAANVTKALGDEDLAQEAAEELVGGDDYATVNPAALSIEAVHLVNEMGYDAAFAKCDFWKEYMDSPQTPDEGSPTLADAAKECRASAAGLSNEAPAHDEVEQEHTSDSRC